MDLPFHKVKITHLICDLMYREHSDEVIRLLTESDYAPLFRKAADVDISIELNFGASDLTEENDKFYII